MHLAHDKDKWRAFIGEASGVDESTCVMKLSGNCFAGLDKGNGDLGGRTHQITAYFLVGECMCMCLCYQVFGKYKL